MNPPERSVQLERSTSETQIKLSLDLDGDGRAEVATGLGFLDHLLSTFARHARCDLELACQGDLQVDDHHTSEDCALCLGEAVRRILGDRTHIARFGSALAPLDDALARAVIDLAARPWAEIHLDLSRPTIGDLAAENIHHFLVSFSHAAQWCLHLDILRGHNDHHKAEAAFKALALAFKEACRPEQHTLPASTKGCLT